MAHCQLKDSCAAIRTKPWLNNPIDAGQTSHPPELNLRVENINHDMNELSLLTRRPPMKIQLAESAHIGGWASPEVESIPPSLPGLGLRTILVPVDFSNVSAVLLRGMAWFAMRSGAKLHILHVVEPSGILNVGRPSGTQIDSRTRARAARLQLHQWAKRTLPSQVSIHTVVRGGRAADEIVSQSQALHADIVVMSAHVGQGAKNTLVRTTTERVVRHAFCPVLVIAKDKINEFLRNLETFPPPSWKRVLLPVDLSSRVPEALAYAAAIAMENTGRLHLLHAVTSDTSTVKETTPRAGSRLTEWLRTELRWPVEWEATVWTDTPLLHAILAEAGRSKIDVIILPARDCAWSRRYRLWSVTDGILRHAPCPVLCVSENAKSSARWARDSAIVRI
jgi:universal stress protein A